MPIYDYHCDACGHSFSQVQSYTDPTLDTCPQCGARPRKLMARPAIVFKGSGWYKTDSRAGSADAKADAKADGGEVAAPATTTAETKSDTKAEPKAENSEKAAEPKAEKSEKTEKTEKKPEASKAKAGADH